MVKQGQFAGVSSAKRLKNFKQQAKATEAKAITPEKVGGVFTCSLSPNAKYTFGSFDEGNDATCIDDLA